MPEFTPLEIGLLAFVVFSVFIISMTPIVIAVVTARMIQLNFSKLLQVRKEAKRKREAFRRSWRGLLTEIAKIFAKQMKEGKF